MTFTVFRFRAFILVVWTVVVSTCPIPGLQESASCVATEVLGTVESSNELPQHSLLSQGCCSFWEVSTRCLSDEFFSATEDQELVTSRFQDQRWCGSSEAELFFEIQNQSAWTVLFVHGNRTNLDSARCQASAIFESLKQRATGPIRFIYLSWPSEKSRQSILPSVLVDEKKELIRVTGLQLAKFLQRSPKDSIHGMVGFSFGCAIIGYALHLQPEEAVCGCTQESQVGLTEQTTQGPVPCVRLGFIAPAMDRCAMQPSGEYRKAMDSVGHLVNLYNSRDPVLRRFRFFDRQKPIAAGYAGLLDTKFQPLAQNARIMQFDCKSIGATHALKDYFHCDAYGRLLDNVLGNDPGSPACIVPLSTK